MRSLRIVIMVCLFMFKPDFVGAAKALDEVENILKNDLEKIDKRYVKAFVKRLNTWNEEDLANFVKIMITKILSDSLKVGEISKCTDISVKQMAKLSNILNKILISFPKIFSFMFSPMLSEKHIT